MFYISSVNGDLKPLSDVTALNRANAGSVAPISAVASVVSKATASTPEAPANPTPLQNSSVRGHTQYRESPPPPERKPALLAKQIMSGPVVTVGPDDNLSRTRKLFRERRFRHVPVVSSAAKLIGILSDRDFIAPLDPIDNSRTIPVDFDQLVVRDLMKTNILTARPETGIRAIAKVMIEHRIGSMPIVDPTGKLVGIITRSDILRAVVNRAPLELWT